MNFQELLDLPNGETIALKLMHEALFEHLAARGLQIDYGRRRAHYPRGEEPEVKVTYRGRARTATRTVVKARTKRDSDDVIYYEHKAFSFSILRFGDDWALVITPGYAFTRDGIRKPISRERTNILSTRRAALDFNQHVMNDVVFWLAVLSNESDGMFALEYREENDLADFGPTVLLSHRMPTISYNVAAFELSDQDPRIVEDMERLEKELEDLANEPEEDDLEEDNTEEDEAD